MGTEMYKGTTQLASLKELSWFTMREEHWDESNGNQSFSIYFTLVFVVQRP